MIHWLLMMIPVLLNCKTIYLAGVPLEVEIADTPSSQEKGLMWRTSLAENTGMLFVYREPLYPCIWMKNTLIPLSIGFFDANCALINTFEMEPPAKNQFTLPNYTSARPALYALELPAGWFKEHNVRPGAKFHFQRSE